VIGLRACVVAATMAIAGLMLSGCIDLAPPDRRPPAPVPATLPTGGAYPPTAAQPIAAWRDFFADARLAAVIDQALKNNRDLRIAVANAASARGVYGVQRADLFPKLGATASAAFGQTPGAVVGRGLGGSGGRYNERLYDLNAGVSAWQLDLFGRVRDSTRAALETYFARREARDAAQVTLVGEVANAWLTLGADRSLLAIARDTQASADATAGLIQSRFTGGVASGLDVAQAQTATQQARYDVARLTSQVARDRNGLELLVGAPVADDLLPADIEAGGGVLPDLPSGVPSAVLLSRPDVLQAEDQLKSANANVGAARAAFFPSIALTGSGGVTSLALSTLLRAASETWTFAPTITQPIFNFGANRGNLASAKGQRDAALATYEKAVQTAFREVSDALATRGTIDEQLAAQRALADAADTAYSLANARYQRGADTYLNALVAQRTLYAARQTVVTTRLARATNLVTLYSALGGGLR
jgi:multidrug efflux system outer membrane protein